MPQQPAKENAKSVGERLLNEFENGYSVTLGSAAAPMLYVAVTPSCAACKEFWKDIRAQVQKGVLCVRLYPAGLQNSDDERAAARLLQAANPLEALNKYMDGDIRALAGAADPAALDHVRMNTVLINRWHFPTAPFLWYRTKGDQIKVVQGRPKNTQDILGGLAPEKREARP